MKEIDARGLSCPAPVLHTKAALESRTTDGLKVIVDNAAAQQNVQRFLNTQGFETTLTTVGEDFVVIGQCGPDPLPDPHEAGAPPADTKKIMVLCATDRMGHGDDALGKNLLANFLRTLPEMGNTLWRLVFVNNGVKLAVEGAETLGDLQALETAGLTILVCGTCLTHFDLLGKKQVGVTTNMLDIVTAMQLADQVITL